MIVVADSSPLNYLVLIGHVNVLHQLYGRVVMPAGVASELRDSRSPKAVRTWASAPPDWLAVRSVQVPADAGLDAVDSGEAEAIVLAEGNRPDMLLIIDDRDSRREAARRGIATTDTLGVLNDAAGRDLIDLSDALNRLDQTTFRVSPACWVNYSKVTDGGERNGPMKTTFEIPDRFSAGPSRPPPNAARLSKSS